MLLHLDRTQAAAAEAKLDALVAATQENLLYTTGILNVNSFVLPRMVQSFAVLTAASPEHPALVMGVGDADQTLSAFPGVGPLYCFGSFYREAPDSGVLNDAERRISALTSETAWRPNAAAALVDAIRQAGLSRATIGIDEEGMQPAVRAQVAGQLPDARFVDASHTFRRIRMVKTPAELARLRKAQAVCETGIKAVAEMAAAGVTERDMVAAYAQGVVRTHGRPAFALIKIGRNGAIGQLPPSDTALQKGDHVWFDVGAQVEGYHADLARILVLGEPGKKLRAYYTAALRGEEHAFSVTRPGMTADRLFTETVEAVRRAGIPHYRRHHVGHGIGAEVYDPPVLNATTTVPIEAGMVINVETPYYELGWGAVHVEDPFLVNAGGGNEWLTTMDRDLLVVE